MEWMKLFLLHCVGSGALWIHNYPQNFWPLVRTLILAARGWEIEKLEFIKHSPRIKWQHVHSVCSKWLPQIVVMQQGKRILQYGTKGASSFPLSLFVWLIGLINSKLILWREAWERNMISLMLPPTTIKRCTDHNCRSMHIQVSSSC